MSESLQVVLAVAMAVAITGTSFGVFRYLDKKELRRLLAKGFKQFTCGECGKTYLAKQEHRRCGNCAIAKATNVFLDVA